MILVVGLGNPGSKYDKTRHNIGFEVIDALSEKYQIGVTHKEHKGLTGKGMISNQKVMLVKPQTYMNLSGECVIELSQYYGIDPKTELIVISDDVALSCGRIRVRKKGSAGGHNGLKDIIAWTDTTEFARVRVGVGELPEGRDMVDHVLGRYNEEDRKLMDSAIDLAIGAVEMILADDIDGAMNKYNTKEML
ncbi:MAG: aminoacyl-tRNA hydrolase [Pseudobutyrivibrio sp.]|nr:aminoacyl-tRNA hydrolase [Pseudobutyrivibrio sp.]